MAKKKTARRAPKKTAKKTARKRSTLKNGTARWSPKKNLTREKRVLLTLKEEQELEITVLKLGQELECSLGLSHVMRSCIRLIKHSEKKLIAEARNHGPLRRPANDDIDGIGAFETQLAKLLLGAFKKSGAYR